MCWWFLWRGHAVGMPELLQNTASLFHTNSTTPDVPHHHMHDINPTILPLHPAHDAHNSLFRSDTNFAPLILHNGSLVAMWRHWGGGNGGSRIFLATASDWRDPSTYVQHHNELFPDLGCAGTEVGVRWLGACALYGHCVVLLLCFARCVYRSLEKRGATCTMCIACLCFSLSVSFFISRFSLCFVSLSCHWCSACVAK